MTLKTRLLALAILVLFSADASSQWKNKKGFCGPALKKWQLKEILPQATFLGLHENDTIVDIGASSGWFEGALGAVSPVKFLNFILLDIDSACLNEQGIMNMIKYYEGMKGGIIDFNFEVVINSETSLTLGSRTFSKILIRNTLHEVSDRELLARQVSAVTKTNGELFIIEVMPTEKTKIHKGCHKPLMTFAEINTLFENNGFLLKEKQEQFLTKKTSLQLLRFVKKA